MRWLSPGVFSFLFCVQNVTADVDCSRTRAGDQPLPIACLKVVEQLPPINVVDSTGLIIQAENVRRWKPICGSDTSNLSPADFADIVKKCEDSLTGPTTVINHAALRGGLFTMVFNVSGSPPTGATDALDAVATYYETQFSDPVTVTFNVSFAALGAGILGATSADFINNISYSSIRTNLINLPDFDDIIQGFLPTGSSCPVRYNSASATVNNQTTMDVTEANWAAVTNNDVAGSNANITFSTNFTFDYDPSNGITGGQTCFRSVCVHEVGHALGFTSKVDDQVNDMEMLDIFRFQTTDGSGDYNPDDASEFQSRPRLVHYNSPDDQHHMETMLSNQTLVEYRFSDGTPSQASHWRSQGNPGIGIMNPSIGSGITYAPNYLRTADTTAFDAIGWDYPAVDPGDMDPPAPDPMSFSIPPAGSSDSVISMQAAVAADVETPPVQYQFDFAGGSGIGHDSAFQASRDYVDTGLTPNNFYRYRVRAADSRPPNASPPGPNVTQYSAESVAYTLIETPLSVSFGATDDTSIVVNADGSFTNLGFGSTGFYFEMNPPAGTGANVWVSDPFVTVTGLTPCTQYTFRVKARNLNADETSFTASSPQSTTGCTGCILLGDVNGSGAVEGGDIAGFIHAKLGAPQGGEFPLCADYGSGTLEDDTSLFVNDLLVP